MSAPRLLMDRRLGPGVELDLDEAHARHVVTVLRLGIGDRLRPFNAEDGEWSATITAVAKRAVRARVSDRIRPPRAVPDLDLLFAPVKRHATDLIVEKAAELGVRRIKPVITQRTVAETVRLERLNAIAREAAEQTERFDAPQICEPLTLARALDAWDTARALIYCDEHGDAAAMLEALRDRCSTAPGGGIALLTGPEGGFTLEERAMLRGCAFVTPVSLGPRILRAETAVIAGLTIIQSAWGDWRDA
jgi:16S rRNA (uracil1498-N3)-methyltransferase